ncbi:MAG: ParB/RepB/Spo0J family partition protein [Gammaproteobacteria bacterium]|nr:ParB/RepB/Spo0J family partition protein [Gammaproteobacteria bacterium]
MQLRKVDPRKIKVPEVRVTSQFDEDTRQQFEAAVREWGIETPILCFEVEGELVLVDGKNRLDEVIAQGTPSVDVVVREGDMVQVLTRNIFLDHLRGRHNVSDMIRVIRSLSEDYHLDSVKIEEQTKLTRDYIERLLKISTASPEVLKALDRGIIGVGAAYEISRLPHPVQQEEMVAKQQTFGFKVGELRQFIDNVLAEMKGIEEQTPPSVPIEPRPAPTYHCEGCNRDTQPRYLRPVMLCPDCFGAVWRLGKAAVVKEEEVEPGQGGG